MSALPSIEDWRSTLTETARLRLNHPSAVLKNYRKAIAIKPAPKSVISPTAPAPPTPITYAVSGTPTAQRPGCCWEQAPGL
jgi:hypothetical protein